MEAGACARTGQCRGATKASLTARCRTPSTRSGSSTTSLPAANSASSPRILSCWLCWTRCCSCAPGAGCVWITAVWRCALTLCVAGGLAGVRDDWTGQAGAFQGCEATPVRQHQRTPWLLLSLRSHAHTPHVATRPPQVQTDERRHAVQDRGGAQPDPVGKHGRPAADGAGGREDVRHRAVLLAELVHQHGVTPCRGLAWATVRWYAHARYLAKHGQHGMVQYSRSTVGAVVTVVAVWLPAWPGSWHGQHEGCHLQRSRLHTPSLAESHGHRAQRHAVLRCPLRVRAA